MQYRLRRHEKEAIRRLYRDNAIYQAFATPCRQYEVMPKGFKMSPEELLMECMAVLDDIKETPEDARFQLQGLWNDRMADYQELSGDVSCEHIETAVNMVTLCVAICLNTLSHPLYNTLTAVLLGQLQGDESSLVQMREGLMANIFRLGEEKFQKAVAEYMDSDEFASDDIAELLAGLPGPRVSDVDDRYAEGEKYDQLSNRQLMLFVDFFVNAGFKRTSETPVNVTAYSRLLGLLAGRSADSIRKKMADGIDYDSESVKDDIKYLAELLKPVRKDLAERFLSQID